MVTCRSNANANQFRVYYQKQSVTTISFANTSVSIERLTGEAAIDEPLQVPTTDPSVTSWCFNVWLVETTSTAEPLSNQQAEPITVDLDSDPPVLKIPSFDQSVTSGTYTFNVVFESIFDTAIMGSYELQLNIINPDDPCLTSNGLEVYQTTTIQL